MNADGISRKASQWLCDLVGKGHRTLYSCEEKTEGLCCDIQFFGIGCLQKGFKQPGLKR
jgi:hypothetical protein